MAQALASAETSATLFPPVEYTVSDTSGWYPADLTAEIAALAENTADVETTPFWRNPAQLARFLVARDRDVTAAEAQYRHAMAWRAEFGADRLLQTYVPPEAMALYFPTAFAGLDKEGYPLLVELVGRIDLPGLYASVGEEGFLRFVAWYHEVQETVMARIAAAANAPRHMMDVVIDMAGLSTRHASTSVYKVLSKRTRLEEDNYPEVCKRVSIVRAPGLFSGIWSMVKGFMDPGTRAKVQIASASSTPEVMANIAEKSQLPPQVDGTMTTVRLPQGGVLPQHFIAGYGTTGESRLLAKGAAEYQWIPLPAKGGVSVSWQVADGKDVEVAAWAVPAGTLAPPGAAARSVVGPLMPALGMQCALLADLPAETEPWFEKRLPYAVVRAPRDAAGAAPLFEGDTLGDSLPPGAVVQECSVMTAPQGSPPDVAQCVLAPKRAANDTFTHVVTADSAAQPPALAPVLEAGFSTGTHSAEAASAGAPTEAITALQARVSNVAKNAPGGYLVLRWSNTYAWMHSKTVARQVKLWVE